MRGGRARDTQEVRSGVPGGCGSDRAGDREVDRAGRPGLGVTAGTLGNWCARDRAERDHLDGLGGDERAELLRLRAENAELRMERDVRRLLTNDVVLVLIRRVAQQRSSRTHHRAAASAGDNTVRAFLTRSGSGWR